MSGDINTNKISKFARNAVSLTVGRVIGDFSAFLFIVYISRRFGEYELGQYSFAIAISGFFMVVSDYGLEFHSIRNLSKQSFDAKNYFSQVLALRTVLTILAYLLLGIISYFVAEDNTTWKLILIIGLSQLLLKAIDGFATVFVANEQMHVAALMTTSNRVLGALAVGLMLFLGYGFIESLLLFPLITIFHCFVGYHLTQKRLGNIFPSFNFKTAKNILIESTPLAASEFLRQASSRTDIFIIGILVGMAGAGIYNAAFRIVFMLSLLFYFLSVTIMPAISKLHDGYSIDELKTLFNNGLRALILIGMPMSVGIYAIAPEVVLMTFGDAFQDSVFVLRLLACLIFVACLKWAMHVFLISTELQNEMVRSQAICAGVNIIGTIILVLVDGIRGAAIATIVSEIVLIILYVRCLKDYFLLNVLSSGLIAGIAGSCAFLIFLHYYSDVGVTLKICASCIIYFLILISFKSIRRQEFSLLLSQLKRK